MFRFLIPAANYADSKGLSLRQRYRWALLDTFDMLALAYDIPQRGAEACAILESEGLTDIRRRENPGLNLVARKGGSGGEMRVAG